MYMRIYSGSLQSKKIFILYLFHNSFHWFLVGNHIYSQNLLEHKYRHFGMDDWHMVVLNVIFLKS
jgi:hypothetical protein